MSELRQNFLNQEWVIIATERAKRPEEMATHRPVPVIPAFMETCVFCPGNESKTPREVMRFPADVAQSGAVRVVPH
jgi:UDPglucose--hexose-1-phosphate uridylyltransferase